MIVDAIAENLDVDCSSVGELEELEQDTKPEDVLKQLENGASPPGRKEASTRK